MGKSTKLLCLSNDFASFVTVHTFGIGIWLRVPRSYEFEPVD